MAETATPDNPNVELALSLDFGHAATALEWGERLKPHFEVAKVGMPLIISAGRKVFADLRDMGYKVFADFKFSDIPRVVGQASFILGLEGVSYATYLFSAGEAMLLEGVSNLRKGAELADFPPPVALGVVSLTSLPEENIIHQDILRACGCDGYVSTADGLKVGGGDGLFKVVPAVRLDGQPLPSDDQKRTSSPAAAVAAGADMVVVGRQVLLDDKPEEMAKRIREAMGVNEYAHQVEIAV